MMMDRKRDNEPLLKKRRELSAFLCEAAPAFLLVLAALVQGSEPDLNLPSIHSSS